MAQFNVNLAFSADTGKAKAQIQELQLLLNKIAYTGSTKTSLTTGIEEAATAAKQLQFHLNNAFNATTGKFDLSLLDRSLKTSNSSIRDLSLSLLNAGTDGQQAFLKLAQSISLADQPMLRISNRMKEFGVTLKNTVKWQLSSSMMHGFMGSIQSAYGYAKDLNKSLNDIRIVTGYNTDQMAEFAEQANKAAKNLSTTTTDYTKASLIYFQQGLSDAEVTERTDVTIKMANAAGQSAQIVSDQLTAVWNNFDNGTKSLEYYADVMTALGAATATSTDEISQGLSKFAAVAETVGLSYEYATAALATITSNTRESADVVGNALKTLFARLQGLKLGETLEDGVDLNKYSEALDKAGISIFQSNGELKAMDNILTELAGKWDTMNNSQQVALAQTVAGVRQYTQLIALMDNWDSGDADSMMANLETISGSQGALDKQADIYAQSWEAAEKRVKASAESIYQSLLDDKFFISLNNGFANVLTGIDSFIDGLGGVKPLINSIASLFLSNFAHKIPQALDNLKYNLQILIPKKGVDNAYAIMSKQMQEVEKEAFSSGIIDKNSSLGVAIKEANRLTVARNQLALVSDKMSESEKQLANMQLSIIQQAQDEVVALTKKGEALQKNIEIERQAVISSMDYFNSYDLGEAKGGKLADKVDIEALGLKDFDGMGNLGGSIAAEISNNVLPLLKDAGSGIDSLKQKWGNVNSMLGTDFQSSFKDIEKSIQNVNKENFSNVKQQLLGFLKVLPSGVRDCENIKKALQELRNVQGPDDLKKSFTNLKTKLNDTIPSLEEMEKILASIHGDKIHTLFNLMHEYSNTTKEAKNKTSELDRIIKQFQPDHVVRMSEAFGALAGLAGNVSTVIRSIISASQALANPELSGWEKLTTVLMSVSMIIPSILSGLSSIGTLSAYKTTLLQKENVELTKQAILNALINTTSQEAYASAAKHIKEKIAALSLENKEKLAQILTNAALEKSENELTDVKRKEYITRIMSITGVNEENAAKILEAHTNKVLETTLWGVAKARLAAMPKSLKVILGIVAAVAAVVAIFNLLTTSQKEANEAISETNEKYSEEKQKLDELNNSLKTTQDRIKELNEQDSLSIVEQEELDKLKQQEISLQRQIALQKELTKAAQQEQVDTIEKNFKTSAKLTKQQAVTKDSGIYTPQFIAGEMVNIGHKETLEEYKERVGYNQAISKGTDLEWISENADAYNKILQWEKEIQDAHNAWLRENAEQIEANENNYANYIQGLQDLNINRDDKADEIAEGQSILKDQRQLVYGDDYEETILAPIVNSLDTLENIDFSKGTNIDWANVIGVKNLDLAGVAEKDFDNYMDSAMDTIRGKANGIPDILNKIDESLASLDPKSLSILLKNLDQIEHWDPNTSLQDFINGLDDGGQGLSEKLQIIKELKNDLSAIIETTSDLKIGDIIDEEAYQLLVKYNEELSKYFMLTSGGYRYLGGASEDQFTGSIDDQIADMQKYNQFYDTFDDWTYTSGDKKGQAFDWSAYQSEGISATTLNNLANVQGVDWSLVGKGYDADEIRMLGDNLGAEGGQAAAEAFMEVFNEAMRVGQESGFEAQEELRVSNFNVSELDKYAEQNKLTQEQYSKYLKNSVINEAEELDFDIEGLQDYADHLKEIGELSEDMALKIALAEKKQGKATEDLIDNYKEYAKVLKKADLDKTVKDTEEYSSAIGKLRKDLSLLTGISEDVFSEKFINSDKVQQALSDVANGVDGAVEKLKVIATLEDIQVNAKVEVSDEELKYLETELAEISSKDITIGTMVDNSGALMGLYDLLTEAGLTTDQIQDYFNKLGWDPQLDYVKMTAADAANNSSYTNKRVWVPDGMGWKQVTLTDFGSLGISGDTEIWVPRIGSKNGGGGFRKIDPPGGGTSKKPSGGGGGGGSQPKYAEKKSSSEKERYHTLTNQLEDLKSEYDDIAEASDRAFGQEKLDNIDAEIEKTDELIKKQEEYVKAIADNLPVDKAVMEAYYQDTIGGPAMKFDERGNISNYDEIQDAMFNKYNAMTSHDEESLEWQTFEKKYEQLEKYIEQYEETYDLLRDEETAYQELLNQRIDLELEKVQYKVELELAIPEDEIALIEYQLGRIDEDAFKSAESIELLTRQAESLYDQIQINKQGLNDVLNLSLSAAEIVQVLAGDASVLDGKVFTEEQIDAIKEYRDNLLDLNEEFDDVRESIEEQVMEVFDAWNEKLQEGTETLEHYGSILESYKNIVDIVGKDTLGLSNKFMEDLDKAAVDNSINEVLAAKDAYESMLETQKAAQEALEDAHVRNDEESIQMWEENLRTINEESRSMQEELLSKWEDALDTIATMFESTVERVIEAFNESIYALGGLEGLSEEFSRQQEIADILVDDYKKIYELSKLNRDINKAIDDTELIGGKQKLKKLLQEINKLQEDGVEMSEYDLEYLQKTFDLRMAELELEEAQRAKNTVRLSKDNEGNWSYIYTQNTDAVDAAQQKYEDALYAMQDLSSNYINEMSEQLISTSQEMAEALAEIRIQDYASIDDYYAEVERVQQQYQDELAMQESELQKAIDNNKQLYDEDWTNYHAATGYKISDTEDFVTTFKDSMLGSMLDSESATANFTDILTEATETLTAGLMTGAMDYYIALEEAMNAAGTSTGGFATDTSKNIDQIVEKSKEGAEAVDQMALEMQEALGAVIDTVSTWQETYGTAMQNIIDVNLEVIKSFNDMLEALSVGGNTTVTVDYNIENSPESILNPSQFDTGGYTGTWGNTGKLAILHEKELILEPKDTVNMLNALKISKSMLDTIELNAQQASRGIGYTTPTVIKEDNTQTLEQMVHITAEFPHVTDHNEIEEAFKNLTNTASQYANRK